MGKKRNSEIKKIRTNNFFSGDETGMKKTRIRKLPKSNQKGFSRDDAVKTGRFLAFFIIIYLILSILIKFFFPIIVIEQWVADNVLAFLQFLGYQGYVTLGQTAVIHIESGPAIEISELCTGLMETMIIVSAIIASAGIDWRKRLFGSVSAGLATIVLNFARIVFTILLILGTADIVLITFAHNILFRAFLLISIAGMYMLWFWWAVKDDKKGKK